MLTAGPKELEGKTIASIVRGAGLDEAEVLCLLLCRTKGQGSIVYHALGEKDLLSFMRDPLCSIGTDAFARNYTGPTAAGKPHPRNYGAFPRWFQHYVLEQKLFSLEEGVKKVTAVPAAQFGLSGLGVLREGRRADLTVFDPKAIRENGDFAQPNRAPNGVRYVVIQGRLAVEDGVFRPIHAGGVVSSRGTSSS